MLVVFDIITFAKKKPKNFSIIFSSTIYHIHSCICLLKNTDRLPRRGSVNVSKWKYSSKSYSVKTEKIFAHKKLTSFRDGVWCWNDRQ